MLKGSKVPLAGILVSACFVKAFTCLWCHRDVQLWGASSLKHPRLWSDLENLAVRVPLYLSLGISSNSVSVTLIPVSVTANLESRGLQIRSLSGIVEQGIANMHTC